MLKSVRWLTVHDHAEDLSKYSKDIADNMGRISPTEIKQAFETKDTPEERTEDITYKDDVGGKKIGDFNQEEIEKFFRQAQSLTKELEKAKQKTSSLEKAFSGMRSTVQQEIKSLKSSID